MSYSLNNMHPTILYYNKFSLQSFIFDFAFYRNFVFKKYSLFSLHFIYELICIEVLLYIINQNKGLIFKTLIKLPVLAKYLSFFG